MKERNFTAITLTYTAPNGAKTSLVQYLENDLHLAHLVILDSINDIERGKFWPARYGLETPCPAMYEWQAQDESELYCNVELVTMVSEKDVDSKSVIAASDYLRNIRNGGDPEFKVNSNSALKQEAKRLMALQGAHEPTLLVAEMSSNGMIDKVYSDGGKFCLMVVDEEVQDSPDFNYSNMQGESKLVYGVQSEVGMDNVAWFDLVTNIGQPVEGSSYVLEGREIVEINSEGGREVLVLTTTLSDENLRKLVSFLND
ncbi:hypothetical protein [Vibrio owensii]|uniref:hypothetical protein n=1 Tax=Vibrio owensii TaxID=696485 RepID=UPI0018F14399|nr:hypothetical protein [Vibrio owensii]